MIRRVTRRPRPPALTVAGLPPGTPANPPPMGVTYISGDKTTVFIRQVDPVVATSGQLVYLTGPGGWGQVVAAGRP